MSHNKPLRDLPDNWQQADIEKALRYVPHRRVAVDAGAHRGIVTRHLLRHFPTVVAVEPTPLADLLPVEALVSRVALGAKAGRCSMQPGTENTGQSHVVPGTDVEMLPLDTLLPSMLGERLVDLDFIKLDVEGMETDVLLGAEMVIKLYQPVIMFEDNGLSRRYGHPLGMAGTLLRSWGMQELAVVHQWKEGADYVYGW